jgi:hypothetical protein
MTKPSCCESPQWVSERDLGHADSMDFILGKCQACGKYSMNVFAVATAITGYELVLEGDLNTIRSLPDGKEMKAFMKDWSYDNC